MSHDCLYNTAYIYYREHFGNLQVNTKCFLFIFSSKVQYVQYIPLKSGCVKKKLLWVVRDANQQWSTSIHESVKNKGVGGVNLLNLWEYSANGP